MSIATKKYSARTAMDVFKSFPEGTRVQLIENMIVMEPSPLFVHQDVAASIENAIYSFVKRHDLGKVLFAPMDVYLDAENAFQPDILFIAKERLDIIRRNGIYGTPDLIVEIRSASTDRYDRREKKRVYERCGVREYWLVDPETAGTQGFGLVDGAFKANPPARGRICSALLDTEFEF